MNQYHVLPMQYLQKETKRRIAVTRRLVLLLVALALLPFNAWYARAESEEIKIPKSLVTTALNNID